MLAGSARVAGDLNPASELTLVEPRPGPRRNRDSSGKVGNQPCAGVSGAFPPSDVGR
ncbi:Uncharacterised protein [Mycobacterium tuberculosis]|jgi:hypothetical protein|nr:Uncharacterised protein [Mycobacterium tuberculosis]